jgi:hypothetical protein
VFHDSREGSDIRISRRELLAGAAAALGFPTVSRAQSREAVKIGVLAARAGVTAPVGAAGLRAPSGGPSG